MTASCATLPNSVKLELLGSKSFSRLHHHRSRCGLSRRDFAFKGIVAAGASVMASTVYALDLLGFGWSEKALIEYDALVWRDQVVDFVKEIVKEPTVLVGNRQVTAPIESEENVLQKFVLKPLKEIFQRVFLGFLFWQAKQPARIESVLKSVYINAANVDDYLIDSITRPADDPNAGEVYYRLMTRFMSNQRKYTLDSVLSQLSCPLLLVWGDLDPWVGPAKALRIKEFYPQTSIVNLQAGHCPHDEVPELVNKALLDWLPTLPSAAPSLQSL
ncbi:hypothetical protein DH2020_040572 [Rehmannia glutinosa]|uniref:Uncharacterized protein n=1 Tax=Rehmannia glutinosa TaxID=99300 RepID=A0ABR0UUA8_REHGL